MKLKYGFNILYNRNVSDLIIQIKHFKDGKMNGECKTWHINGSLLIKSNYKDNKRDGEFMIYCENGSIQEHLYYKDDKMI